MGKNNKQETSPTMTDRPAISVVICSHNPRPHFLSQVVSSLKLQTLPRDQWELLLIDNASDSKLADQLDLSWHPNARHILEPRLGLTIARLKGFQESKSRLIALVDDDNALDSEYLKQAIAIASSFTQLGAWGASITGDFEVKPTHDIIPQLGYLGIRQVEHAIWTNIPFTYAATPIGAGMVLRREVVNAYITAQHSHPLRNKLDRQGSDLSSCGDHDLAFTACDLGLGTGVFPQLKLTHLIPSVRLTQEYFIRLRGSIAYSTLILEYIRGRASAPSPMPARFVWGLRRRRWLEQLKNLNRPKFERQILLAESRGRERAFKKLAGV